jgi:hypothetical protein
MKKYLPRTLRVYRKKTSNPIRKSRWRIFWDKNKDFLTPFLAGLITLVGAVIANKVNNQELLNNDLRQKKETYIDAYLKSLNESYYFLAKLIDDDGIQDRSVQLNNEIEEAKTKIEGYRTNLSVDSFYDASQFQRYFKGRYFRQLQSWNQGMTRVIQAAQSPQLSIEKINKLGEIANLLKCRKDSIERAIYKEVDSTIVE